MAKRRKGLILDVLKAQPSLETDIQLRDTDGERVLDGLEHLLDRSRALSGADQKNVAAVLGTVAHGILNTYELDATTTPQHQPPVQDGYWAMFKAVIDSAEIVVSKDRLGYLRGIAARTEQDDTYRTMGAEMQLLPYFCDSILKSLVEAHPTSQEVMRAWGYMVEKAASQGQQTVERLLSYGEFMGRAVRGPISRDEIRRYAEHVGGLELGAAALIDDRKVVRISGLGSPAITLWTNGDGRETSHILEYGRWGIPTGEGNLLQTARSLLQ